MRYTKEATELNKQLELLRERGMQITSEDLTLRWLETVGYYRLSAYWLAYEKEPKDGFVRSKKFKDGTKFEDIIDLYIFDRKLRLLVTEAIERIEICARSRWTNRLTLEYGPHAHLRSNVFTSGWKHAARVARISNRTLESSEVFIEHYRSKYTEPYMPPLWAVSELMTFGELSKWIESTDNLKIRSAVARDIGLPTQESLSGTLQLLSYIRNICAHHGRLWNRKTVKRLPNIKRFRASLVLEENAAVAQLQLSNRMYNVLAVLSMLMRHQSTDSTFPHRLSSLMETRSPEQQRTMGIPENWNQLPAWG